MNGCRIEHGERCITCADVAAPMRVRELRGECAVCVDEHGSRHEVAVELLAPLSPGDTVLVHAGVAIA